jgi:hypothetical protein
MTNSDVVVFLTHVFDDEIERRFHKLERECAGVCDVVLFVEQGTKVPPSLEPITQTFDFAAVKTMARSVIGDRVVPGNAHLRSLNFRNRFPRYRFYWFVEYDVVYTGHWGRFMAGLADDRSDLLAAHVRGLVDDPEWHWKDTFRTGADSMPAREWVLAFLPIYRISAAGLEAVEGKLRDGWVGHFEVVVPSALAFCGLGVADLGGSGAWTPRKRVLRHYVDYPPRLLHASSLCFRPPVNFRPVRNKLYHPCKTPALRRQKEFRSLRILVPYWFRVFRLAVRSWVPL